MKAIVYKNFDEIDFSFIANLVNRNEHGKAEKVSLVIVEVDLFFKLQKEGIEKGYFFSQYWFAKDHLSNGIKMNQFRIISSHEIHNEIHLSFDM